MPIFNLSDIKNINQKRLLLKQNIFFIKVHCYGLIQKMSFNGSLARIFIKTRKNSWKELVRIFMYNLADIKNFNQKYLTKQNLFFIIAGFKNLDFLKILWLKVV